MLISLHCFCVPAVQRQKEREEEEEEGRGGGLGSRMNDARWNRPGNPVSCHKYFNNCSSQLETGREGAIEKVASESESSGDTSGRERRSEKGMRVRKRGVSE